MVSTVLFVVLVWAGSASACTANNCLRALVRAGSSASQFCSTYTQATNTATTSLPTFASQCSYQPTRISSACSCLATPTCAPSTVQNTNFSNVTDDGLVAPAWTVTVDRSPAPSQSIAPSYGFRGGFFEAEFPGTQINPFLSTVTLSQEINICNGPAAISYRYNTVINSNGNGAPRNNNCTITSGLAGLPSSVFATSLFWDSLFDTGLFWIPVNHNFTVTGVPDSGLTTAMYFTFECTLVDYWPETQISGISVG